MAATSTTGSKGVLIVAEVEAVAVEFNAERKFTVEVGSAAGRVGRGGPKRRKHMVVDMSDWSWADTARSVIRTMNKTAGQIEPVRQRYTSTCLAVCAMRVGTIEMHALLTKYLDFTSADIMLGSLEFYVERARAVCELTDAEKTEVDVDDL